MCGCTKKSGVTILSNVANARYDFVNDPDFVLVKSVSKYIKEIKPKTIPAAEFTATYGIRTYGLVAYGTQFYILQSDFNYYQNNAVQGVALELVAPAAPQETVVVEEVVEVEETEEVFEPVMPNSIEVSELGNEVSDFTRIKGVGKSTSEKLINLGYNTFAELSNITLEEWESLSSFNNADNYLEFLEKVESFLSE